MTTTLAYYKKLYKNINRLPLDLRSLNRAKCLLRDAFTSGKTTPHSPIGDPKRYKKAYALTESVLSGDFYQISDLLDAIYKHSLPKKPWVEQFLHTKYSAFKPVWPRVHLLHEFGKEKHKKLYDRELQRSTPEAQEFLLMKTMNLTLSPEEIPIKPLPRIQTTSNLGDLVKNMQTFYKFVCRHPDVLLGHKPKPFEIVHEPTRFGLPKSVAARERDYKTKITYMKLVLQEVRPILEEAAHHLGEVASGRLLNPETVINPRYFIFASRQHRNNEKKSPFEKKYLSQKQLVPTNRNIQFFYRDYAVKQFFEQTNGDFRMTPVRFYD